MELAGRGSMMLAGSGRPALCSFHSTWEWVQFSCVRLFVSLPWLTNLSLVPVLSAQQLQLSLVPLPLPQSWGKAVLLLLDRRSRCYPPSSSFSPQQQLWHGMLLAWTRIIPHPHYSPWVLFPRSTIEPCVDVLVLGALVELVSTTRSASLPFPHLPLHHKLKLNISSLV